MSQFDRRTTAQYAKQLRNFLGKRHPASTEFALLINAASRCKGRPRKHPVEALKVLEAAVNVKAERCEASGTTFKERYLLARDYRGWSDGDVSRELNLSHEAVRRWRAGLSQPSRISVLASALNVPCDWLRNGGEEFLPADSHLGVRVGELAMDCREKLYGLTCRAIYEQLPDDVDDMTLQKLMEALVRNNQPMSKLARQAGGRWLIRDGELVFAAWIALEPFPLSRKLWKPEVESIIQEELAHNPTVYAAWLEIKLRCEQIGQAYPQKITLYKRRKTSRLRAEKFGVRINTPGFGTSANHF